MLTHYFYKQKLSAYLDGELNAEEIKALEAHLDTCGSCQTELAAIREGKALTSYFEQTNWQGSAKLWARLQAAKNSTNSKADLHQVSTGQKFDWPSILKPRAPLLWAAAVLVIMLLVARNMVQIQLVNQPDDGKWPIQTASAFSIDFGLYLDALKNGKEPVEFERQYGSKITTYEGAQSKVHFRLPPLPKMLETFELSEVQTFKSACCFSIQMNCVSDSGKVIIFQQPKDHPATFGAYELKKIKMNGRNCLRIEVGSWTALCWDDEESQYVVMSELEADKLAQALRKLM